MQDRQLHIRLPYETYKELKLTCVHQDVSIQKWLADVVTEKLRESGGKRNAKSTGITESMAPGSSADMIDFIKNSRNKKVLHFDKGQVIIHEGEISDYIYFINRGRVRIYKVSLSGKEFTADIRGRDETFAILAALIGKPLFATTAALEDTEIIAISKDDFLVFLMRNPSCIMKIIEIEGERVERLYNSTIDLVANTGVQRLAGTLLSLSTTYGNTISHTQREIAAMSGLTMETAARILSQLKNYELIELARGKIRIKDIEKIGVLSEGSLSPLR